MASTARSIVEALREQAREAAADVNESRRELVPDMNFPDARPHDMLEWEAGDLVEDLMSFLRRIAVGEDNPRQIATDALDPARPLKLP